MSSIQDIFNRLYPKDKLRERSLWVVLCYVVVSSAFWFLIGSVKVIPGSPFVSIVGELFPIFLLCSSIALLHLQKYCSRKEKVSRWFLEILCLVLITVIVHANILYWLDPYSRGPLLGF